MSVATSTSGSGVTSSPTTAAHDSETNYSEVLGIALATVALIIASIGMLFIINAGLRWYNAPFLGMLTTDQLIVDSTGPITSTQWNGFQAGIHPGDQIVGLTADSGQKLTIDP